MTRREMYDAGLNDPQIAKRIGVSRWAISLWRKANNLPPQERPPKAAPLLDGDEDARRRELYGQGLSDGAIAKAVDRNVSVIAAWRKRRDLPPNFRGGDGKNRKPGVLQMTDELREICLRLVRRGFGVALIARGLSVSQRVVGTYRRAAVSENPALAQPILAPRRVPRFPSGKVYSGFRPERRRKAFALYAKGASDREIAVAIGTAPQQVYQWRTRYGLPINTPKRKARPARRPPPAAITPFSNDLYARVANAIGRTLTPDMADDAISELVLAVLEGRVSVDQVKQEARRFRSRALTDYANRQNRSIDEQLGDDAGFRLVDMLRDERSSAWLEEQGATVW